MIENPQLDPKLVGDLTLTNKAYGLYQIRKPYLDDVYRLYGAEMVRTFGRRLTLADMQNRQAAEWVCWRYLDHYGERYRKATGRSPDIYVYTRIHNGGPNGWAKQSTIPYMLKVQRFAGGQR